MRFWEDLPIGEVDCFGEHVLSADEVVDFRARFAPPEFAAPLGFAEDDRYRDAVPGLLLCCVAMRLLVEHSLNTLASRGSPGVDRIEWPAPAFVGDLLSVRTEVLSSRALKSHPDMGLLKQHLRLCNQRGEVVTQMWTNVLIARREVGNDHH